jgi:hypothetical protein
MNRVKKSLGVAGLGVLCAVGLGSTAHAATGHTTTAGTTIARPMVNISKYEGNYPNEQSCLSFGQDPILFDGASYTDCIPQPDGTYDLYAYWD